MSHWADLGYSVTATVKKIVKASMWQSGIEWSTFTQATHEPLPGAMHIVTSGKNQVFTNKKEGGE